MKPARGLRRSGGMQKTHASTQIACPGCGYSNATDALCCGMCGKVLQRESGSIQASGASTSGAAERDLPPIAPCANPARVVGGVAAEAEADGVDPPIAGLSRPLFFFLLGIPLALVVAGGALGQRFAWFFAALFHETGHSVVGIFFGLPSFPAISLAGHAVTMHDPQLDLVVVAVWIALGALAWQLRARRMLFVALAVASLAYPLVAWTGAKEFFFLTGGHLGELAFATLCLTRAWSGGFTSGPVERSAYSMIGWLLVGTNVGMCWRLMTSAHARAVYAGNGSYGLTNDYLRLADDVIGVSLQSVALMMFVVALISPLLAFGIGRWRS
jgi:ribosomal protein S27E